MNTMIRRLTRRAASLVVAASLALGGVAATTAPAQAAAGVSACFTYRNGGPYVMNPVYLQLWNGSSWQNVSDGRTNWNGCTSFTMSGSYRDYASRILAQHNIYDGNRIVSTWLGASPYYAPAGSLSYNLGTGVVRCYSLGLACPVGS